MHLYVAAVVLGVAAGGTYALLAVSVTQVFAVTRILNFAQAGFTVWGGSLYALLTGSHHWPVGLAAVTAIIAAGAIGLLAERLLFRFAQRAAPANKILLTFGMLSFLLALATIVFGQDFRKSVSLFSDRGFMLFGGVVTWQRFATLVAVVLVVVSLTLFLRHTRIGLQTRALAEDLAIAELMGVDRNRIGMINWTVAAMVGGLAGVLMASLHLFQPGLYLVYFMFALVATVVGGLRSLAWAAVGGIALGVIVSVAQVTNNHVGLGTLMIFIGAVAALLLRKRRSDEDINIGWARPHRSKAPRLWWLYRAIVVAGWGAVAVASLHADVWGQVGATIAIYAVIVLSLVPLVGWTGQVSLAQGAFMTVGTAAFHIANREHHLAMPLCIVITLIAGMLAGIVVGAICVRLSFVQSVVITLSVTGVVLGWLIFSPLFPGATGRIGIDTPSYVDSGRSAFIGFMIVAAVVALVLANIARSQRGIGFISVRTAPGMSRHFGVRPAVVKISAYGLSGAIAALAGAMYITMLGNIDVQSLGFGLSLQVLILAVAGGTSSVWGAFVGPLVFLGLPQSLALLKVSGWPDLILGVGTFVVIAARPDGLVSLMRRPTARRREVVAQQRPPVAVLADV